MKKYSSTLKGQSGSLQTANQAALFHPEGTQLTCDCPMGKIGVEFQIQELRFCCATKYNGICLELTER